MCPVILAAVLPVIQQPETFLMNNTLNAVTAIQKISSFFLGLYYVNVFPTFWPVYHSVYVKLLWLVKYLFKLICCLPSLSAEPLWSPTQFFSHIMRLVITILIGINEKWVMAQGTFANSTQTMEYQGIKHTWEGSYNLMKIQLAHFRNRLCTRNKISKTGWKIRALNGIRLHELLMQFCFCIFPHILIILVNILC